MNFYFSNKERITALKREAESWLGTPWVANSGAKGKRGGVACHRLPTHIYINIGALPSDFPVVQGKPMICRHEAKNFANTPSREEIFLDGRKEFYALKPGEELRDGDLVGLQIWYQVDHLGVLLDAQKKEFIHVLMRKHVTVDSFNDATFGHCFRRAWRIVE